MHMPVPNGHLREWTESEAGEALTDRVYDCPVVW